MLERLQGVPKLSSKNADLAQVVVDRGGYSPASALQTGGSGLDLVNPLYLFVNVKDTDTLHLRILR